MSSIKSRDSASNAIKRYMQASKDAEKCSSRESIESYLKLLEEQWIRFGEAQDEVENSCGDANVGAENDVRIQSEMWYMEAHASFHKQLRQLPEIENSNTNTSSAATIPISGSIRLPKMDLPTFSGDSTEWISFNDAFQTLIDSNTNLSDGQKLHYLRSCLKGEALLVISSFKISDANYAEAWKLLQTRYSVMRVIVEKHLRTIFAVEQAQEDSATAIKKVLDNVLQQVRALTALKRPVEFWDDWLVHIVVSKLAFETRKQWELSLTNGDLPTFEELQTFLEKRCQSLAMVASAAKPSNYNRSTFKKPQKSSTPVLHSMQKIGSSAYLTRNCLYCNNNHNIYSCPEYDRLELNAKVSFIKQKGACLNCLSIGHHLTKCHSSYSCRICQKRHHTSIHGAFNSNGFQITAPLLEANSTNAAGTNAASTALIAAPTTSQTARSAAAATSHSGTTATALLSSAKAAPLSSEFSADVMPNAQGTVSHHAASTKAILLATALVRVQDSTGRWQTARALFDNGSHATFMTEACIQRLGLPRKSSLVIVTGIGSTQGGRTRGETTLTIAPLSSNHQFKIDALILSKVTNELPVTCVTASTWPHIQGLTLADPHFGIPGPIDILVGMDEMSQFLTTEIRKGPPDTPLAQNTAFGWVLFGRVGNTEMNNRQVNSLHCDVQLVRAVSRFWELEELPPKKHLTSEELFCEDYFDKTHRRAGDGRFIVELPLKREVPLGETRSIAIKSFLRMEKRFSQNAEMHSSYKAFMQELLKLGHMEPVYDVPRDSFYMPHHPVIKDTSTTTKLRVVFNASVKSSTGYSLNDALMIGPQLQQELFAVLLRFRSHRYAITADVAKMYRQVYVSQNCVNYQRIVWREDSSEPLQDYRLLRVTYGLASASHLAVKALQQTAKDFSSTYPDAAQVILRDFYMDDLLTGSSSKEELCTLQREISEVLASGGFELRKWATNCDELFTNMPHATKQVSHYLASDQKVRALGLIWNTEHDFITFEVNLKEPPSFLSKRSFLSDASLLFDPLGLIAPCTIKSKIWFQQIWRAEVDWDQAVPAEIGNQWLHHRLDLANLSKLKLERWMWTGEIGSSTELHVFADASEKAYAAVLYARTIHANGDINVALVAARTKVAPLKSTSLPRLELCAAQLAAKLSRHVVSSMNNDSYRLCAWSDSTVTLAWLAGHPSRWSTFVANRVADIQEVLPPECWAHVRSESNPADCASRGVAPSDLLQNQLWWQGPPWLKNPNNAWPQNARLTHTTDLEARTKKAVAHIAQPVEYWELLTKYSSYQKLKRITAYLIRFASNARAKLLQISSRTGTLTCNETKNAELALVKYTQNYNFSNEISCCRTNKQLPLRSSLLRLQPFIDENGVLRAGGRIKHANVSLDTKYPIILPKASPLAKLIIEDIHANTLHAGPRIMQTVLQRRFWVLSARNLIRKIYRNCVKCMRINRQPLQQMMADLPISRTSYTRCFLRTAVDFAGPYPYKFAPGRGSKSVKGYIAVFICMSTGAMHLEFVSDLTSAAFLNAYKRFISRRGYCQHIYSDNGTNFIGAEKELRIMFQNCTTDDKVRAYLADSLITWHFNPPSAPHMGGYWETGVKRVKYHLRRAIGDVLLTFEEYSTLLTEVEACVNSRPLCSQTVDSCDFDILTPGHFIVGEPLKSLPEPETQTYRVSLGQRWQAVTAMRRHFWRRWRDEYLVNLQQRTKWFRTAPNVQKGDLVVICDENTMPTKWRMGRVIECNPGIDGRVRVVKLRTAAGELVRPVAKLCLLPTKDDIFTEV